MWAYLGFKSENDFKISDRKQLFVRYVKQNRENVKSSAYLLRTTLTERRNTMVRKTDMAKLIHL